MSFSAYLRRRKLGAAAARLREGAAIDDAVFDSGYESHSGFRDAFTKTLAITPGRAKQRAPRFASLLDTPLGALVTAASDEGVALVEFAGPRALASAQSLGAVPGEHPLLNALASELREYFEGARREFTLPLAPQGTGFQQRVWQELRCIPYGQTISYEDLAARLGNPAAVRAVAQANGRNPISILIPCHRVIGKNGALTGYGGGLWRKRLLLELERRGRWA
jgi:AraC family transcriptional regulator of adaptative response/methylated-DNA-[protein]-cysteine methyltransferase